MKLISHLMKLLHLMTLPSQQFCLCDTLFNVHHTLMKYALRLALCVNMENKSMFTLLINCLANMIIYASINIENKDYYYTGGNGTKKKKRTSKPC